MQSCENTPRQKNSVENDIRPHQTHIVPCLSCSWELAYVPGFNHVVIKADVVVSGQVYFANLSYHMLIICFKKMLIFSQNIVFSALIQMLSCCNLTHESHESMRGFLNLLDLKKRKKKLSKKTSK